MGLPGGDTRMSYENMVKMMENDDKPSNLIGGLKHFLFSPIVGMMIQSDEYVSEGWNHQPWNVGLFVDQQKWYRFMVN